ncbi:SDR family NAD(P)-dependent oxidoreductase [Bradyrhizobium sp. CCGUVB14]|uniref:SDR family NAD(P)-dependent oxidoreductase n=1 Tax=Bradyrhizobium sp. CCGUVB14 TaxID=2949628 RepID=UPI0020B385DE|nr:SDR family oxidoreductase [Bradyrhizobium sp. CCGUVB14]MCP3446093.1 SDR family oxidoreductase [Bradyrhizobium sp. CCGUVB14]
MDETIVNLTGRIVNISSTTVPMGRVNYLHYVTSKAAVLGIIRSVAREVGEDGVTVNAITSTLIETGLDTQVVTEATFKYILERQSIKRTGQPEDLARVPLFLVSIDCGSVKGQTIVVDGGGIHL